jgi:hypothetical protein
MSSVLLTKYKYTAESPMASSLFPVLLTSNFDKVYFAQLMNQY